MTDEAKDKAGEVMMYAERKGGEFARVVIPTEPISRTRRGSAGSSVLFPRFPARRLPTSKRGAK